MRNSRGAPRLIESIAGYLKNAMPANRGSVETIKRYLRVERREIAFIRFVFEAYDGIAVLETLDPQAGIVVFHIAPGCEPDVDAVLRDLKGEILIETVDSSNFSATN